MNVRILVSRDPDPEICSSFPVASKIKFWCSPPILQKPNTGAYVEKRIIALIYLSQQDRLRMDTILVEDHNMKLLVADASEDMLGR